MKTKMMILLFLLPLTACTTMMTPQQHQVFAKDWVVLHACNHAGFISPELAAQAHQLYRFRLQNYKFDEKVMDQHIAGYNQQIGKSLNPALCQAYATHVYGEILDRQQAIRDAEQIAQAVSNFGNAVANSSYRTAQIYNNAAQNMIYQTPNFTPIAPIQPIYPVSPQIKTNCMNVANGMYSCTSRYR